MKKQQPKAAVDVEIIMPTPTVKNDAPQEEIKYEGYLFGTIGYINNRDLGPFIENLNHDQSLYCLIQSAYFAHKQGIFSLEESEIISKALRILTTDYVPPKL